ncbi:hypothetical protein HK096_000274 [Nowakowskiella sp. JEL0078]|nr:hypothetical protein HK096_000274 [Nowakowskiella sp. JEL0078]
MVQHAIKLRRPLQSLILEIKEKYDTVNIITHHEWLLFQIFCNFLEPINDATEIVSTENCTIFATCIPLYNELLDHLEAYMVPEKYFNLVSMEKEDMIEAAKAAFDKLEGYYNKQADIVQVASFVDP